eukprot:COSAG01_NODE_43650_length_427_cov_2.667683_1_plen_24_part_10
METAGSPWSKVHVVDAQGQPPPKE